MLGLSLPCEEIVPQPWSQVSVHYCKNINTIQWESNGLVSVLENMRFVIDILFYFWTMNKQVLKQNDTLLTITWKWRMRQCCSNFHLMTCESRCNLWYKIWMSNNNNGCPSHDAVEESFESNYWIKQRPFWWGWPVCVCLWVCEHTLWWPYIADFYNCGCCSSEFYLKNEDDFWQFFKILILE